MDVYNIYNAMRLVLMLKWYFILIVYIKLAFIP